MLDFFTIFSKGGLVLWCFQGTVGDFTYPVNELIKNVILQVYTLNLIFLYSFVIYLYVRRRNRLDHNSELHKVGYTSTQVLGSSKRRLASSSNGNGLWKWR